MRFPSISILIISILAFCFSCSDDTPEIIGGSFETPVVTGFVYRDATGTPSSVSIGIPNNKSENGKYGLNVFPIPSYSSISIGISGLRLMSVPGESGLRPILPSSPTEVWLVPAIINYNLLELAGIPQNNNYLHSTYSQINTPLWATTLTNNESFVRLTLEDIPAGAYRLYAKVDGEILWENILIKDY